MKASTSEVYLETLLGDVVGLEKSAVETGADLDNQDDISTIGAKRGHKISKSGGGGAGASMEDDLGGGAEFDSQWDEGEGEVEASSKKRSKAGTQKLSEEAKLQRREKNREHAKRSRVRRKFLLESLQQCVHALEDENANLKEAVHKHLPEDAAELLEWCTVEGPSVIASSGSAATKTLKDPDYSVVKALQAAQQNFVISDPSLPDNPIVYASSGFLSLTGYAQEQVMGRNCRFLLGQASDSQTVDIIRAGIDKGVDTTVCVQNYRADGTSFWNQLYVSPLKDGDGRIVNYLGVQCKVTEDYALAFAAKIGD